MAMIELNDLLPENEWEDNWTFYGCEHEGLPADAEYVVFEYYCDNPSCTCQEIKVDIRQLDKRGRAMNQSLAIIDYDMGSKRKRCYPTLAEESPVTPLAYSILNVYEKFIHTDDYVFRIQNQYKHVKKLASGNREKITEKKQDLLTERAAEYTIKVGRNELCPCGSLKKYKKCCISKQMSHDK